jgi:hypothetical protein
MAIAPAQLGELLDRLAHVEVAVQRRGQAGPVRPGLAVQHGRVLDGLEGVAQGQHLVHAGHAPRAQREADQLQAQAAAGVRLQRVGALTQVLAAQVEHGADAQGLAVAPQLGRTGLAEPVHAPAQVVQVVVQGPECTVVHQVHVKAGDEPAQACLEVVAHG